MNKKLFVKFLLFTQTDGEITVFNHSFRKCCNLRIIGYNHHWYIEKKEEREVDLSSHFNEIAFNDAFRL